MKYEIIHRICMKIRGPFLFRIASRISGRGKHCARIVRGAEFCHTVESSEALAMNGEILMKLVAMAS